MKSPYAYIMARFLLSVWCLWLTNFFQSCGLLCVDRSIEGLRLLFVLPHCQCKNYHFLKYFVSPNWCPLLNVRCNSFLSIKMVPVLTFSRLNIAVANSIVVKNIIHTQMVISAQIIRHFLRISWLQRKLSRNLQFLHSIIFCVSIHTESEKVFSSWTA
jgi:hypothetical protein